jgi:hypothetical protein
VLGERGHQRLSQIAGQTADHGHTLFSKAKGSGAKDGLLGFTGSTVTARYGSTIFTYDEKGMTIYAKSA